MNITFKPLRSFLLQLCALVLLARPGAAQGADTGSVKRCQEPFYDVFS
jgi:hypothetical protein